ncbi:hypothetical protein [Acidovorax sp. NCPPB 4044]|uniref:hypothetical protein n=1 Tax=Acidovorax sp. NCPPB 4044 TaxID=2940490 RepID=UPI00230283E1|nr:hypothetical protein [Acidovorax sp. NCPPB 4044]MDA8522421.1 hypothetical protein [Acidovorax sp. NCPPB 4044]
MIDVDSVLWVAIFFGFLLLLLLDAICFVGLILSGAVLLTKFYLGADDLRDYLGRLIAIFAFGGIAIKLKLEGGVIFFVLLNCLSMWIYKGSLDYLTVIVAVIVVAVPMVWIRIISALGSVNQFLAINIRKIDDWLGKGFAPILGVAAAWPFVLAILERRAVV